MKGGDLERSKQKLCRFVIRKNVACFSCTNSKRTFFLEIFKRFLGFFGFFCDSEFLKGFLLDLGRLETKKILPFLRSAAYQRKVGDL